MKRAAAKKRSTPTLGDTAFIGRLQRGQRWGVELNAQGEILIDSHARTSMPGVFAAGDCTTAPYKQIVIALGEGAKASLAAFDHLIRISAPVEKQVKAA